MFCDTAHGLILMMSILFRINLSPLVILLGQVIIIMTYDTATETYLYINTEDHLTVTFWDPRYQLEVTQSR